MPFLTLRAQLQALSGVRALPNRTGEGAPPLLGRIPAPQGGPDHSVDDSTATHGPKPSWWLFTGLGVRGLLYHGIMAHQLAAAVLADDESLLDHSVRRWQ